MALAPSGGVTTSSRHGARRHTARPAFTLYVISDTLVSNRAIANFRRLADDALRGHYDLTIIDVLEDFQAAEDARILTTPTLVRERPLPTRRVTGDLSDRVRLARLLELPLPTLEED